MVGKKGVFVVVDGLDGVGKGEVERAIIGYEQRQGRAVLDTVAFSRAHRKGLPELKDFWNPPEIYYDTLSTAEPTYASMGHTIRHEMIARNKRVYSATSQIQAYSLDRLIQMKRVIIPALENGLHVIQARCCAATLTYQSIIAQDEGLDPVQIREEILKEEGNALQLQYAPDLLIIPLIKDIGKLIQRLRERGYTRKDDNAIFENVEFQGRLNPLFRSTWLRNIFEKAGTKVCYIDASISEHETRKRTLELYKDFLSSMNF